MVGLTGSPAAWRILDPSLRARSLLHLDVGGDARRQLHVSHATVTVTAYGPAGICATVQRSEIGDLSHRHTVASDVRRHRPMDGKDIVSEGRPVGAARSGSGQTDGAWCGLGAQALREVGAVLIR